MTEVKETNYNLLEKQVSSLIEDESNLIAILSNVSALLNDSIDQINWVGFYLIENEALILEIAFKVILHVFISQSAKVYAVLLFLKNKHNL